jgi:predicted CopG family antitoxin
MSTKTIALDSKVYRKLARLKGEGESFSRVIDRLVERTVTAHTGAEILANLGAAPAPLTRAEAGKMEKAVERSRRSEKWELHDLS